ncbi:MAG: leucine-rich repeat protein [Eubacteriales bacterium]|nr:leucine-rich repeat protein [Eubacteriales bacterium]
MLISTVPVAAAAEIAQSVEISTDTIASGICGENLTWTLDSEGTLTISGTGEMTDYRNISDIPWITYQYDIKKVNIEYGATSICAFGGCYNLTSITIPDSVTSIGGGAFSSCYNLTSITIPDSVTSIGGGVFYDCNNLISVKLPSNITSITNDMFNGCTSLVNIEIPDDVTCIDNSAFARCGNLTSVKIPNGVTSINDSAFGGCSSLSNIIIPNSVTTIGENAFSGSGLTKLEIPNSVTRIDDLTFSNCTKLTEVIIPASIKRIDYFAFSGCTSLTEVHFEGDAPKFDYYTFKDVTATAYYPAGNTTWTSSVMQDYGGEITWEIWDPVPVTSISLNKSTLSLNEGDTADLTVTIAPQDATNKTVTWTSSDNSVATVSDGKVTAVAAGTATITATTSNGLTATCNVTVKKKSSGVTVVTPSTPTEPTTPTEPITPTEPTTPTFTDVPAGQFYTDAVAWAVGKGITVGTSDTTFSPNDICNREQIVTFLWRANGSPEPKTTNCPFTDVKPSDFCYKAVLWAVENGITYGTSATTFEPKKGCSRAEVVTFQWRANGEPESSASNVFTDVSTGDYYTDSVAWAVDKGVTVGTSATTFSPNNICTRGEIVTFLYRDMT